MFLLNGSNVRNLTLNLTISSRHKISGEERPLVSARGVEEGVETTVSQSDTG